MLLTSVYRARIQRLVFSVPMTGDMKAVVARATSRRRLRRSRIMGLVDANPSRRLVIYHQAVLFFFPILKQQI